MKAILGKKTSLQEEKVLRVIPRRYFLILAMVAIFSLYVVTIRPYLLHNMATVPIELAIAFILILSVIICILILIVTLFITLIIAIRTRTRARVTPWLLKIRRRLVLTIVLSLVLAVFILYSQWMAYTPPILGDNGKTLVGSVSTLEKIDLGGSQQWITIRGNNRNNPVILFLAGGPGGSQLAATRTQLKKLEDSFVVVNWDQPGAGKSYHAVPLNMLTPERYISDAHKLTQYLCKRFKKEKIFLLGESWGSTLGIWLVQHYPKLYYAFIGTGQMVAFSEAEKLDYKQALKIADEHGDKQKLEKLKNQGPPPYYGNDVIWKEVTYLNYLNDYMSKKTNIEWPKYNAYGDIGGPEYGLYDKVNYLLGMVNAFNHVYQHLYNIDLRKQAVKIDVPVYLMEGRYDIIAPPVLAKEYYNALISPHKEFIWFEHSGHEPWINERDKFVDIMVKLVLRETKL